MSTNLFRNDSQFFKNLPRASANALNRLPSPQIVPPNTNGASLENPSQYASSSSGNTTQYTKTYGNKPKLNKKSVVGTYKVKQHNIAFPVSDDNYPIGSSPFESSIIIEKQENGLLWGIIYAKSVKSTKWNKTSFTGTIDYKGIINIVVDYRTSPDGNPSIYTLTPLSNKNIKCYQVVFQIPGKGISYISHANKISNSYIVPKN